MLKIEGVSLPRKRKVKEEIENRKEQNVEEEIINNENKERRKLKRKNERRKDGISALEINIDEIKYE